MSAAATKTSKSTQLTIRLEQDLVDRLDALRSVLSKPGLSLGRTDVLRMAVVAGLPIVEGQEEKHRRK